MTKQSVQAWQVEYLSSSMFTNSQGWYTYPFFLAFEANNSGFKTYMLPVLSSFSTYKYKAVQWCSGLKKELIRGGCP